MCWEMHRSASETSLFRPCSPQLVEPRCSGFLTPLSCPKKSTSLRRSASFNSFSAKVLGSGSTSVVFKCTDAESGETVAVKSPRSPMGKEAQRSAQALEDSRLLEELRHENVVEHHQRCDDGTTIMEFLDGGSLLTVMEHAGGRLEEVHASVLAHQILKGVAYLHSRNVIHKDIKPANILFDSASKTAKLSDIALASETASTGNRRGVIFPVGTPSFLAPEVVRTGSHVPESDIWAVGCTVLQLVSGRIPWEEEDSSFSALFKIGSGQHPHLPENLSEELISFLGDCFRPVHDRPGASCLLLHPFVANAPPVGPSSRSP